MIHFGELWPCLSDRSLSSIQLVDYKYQALKDAMLMSQYETLGEEKRGIVLHTSGALPQVLPLCNSVSRGESQPFLDGKGKEEVCQETLLQGLEMRSYVCCFMCAFSHLTLPCCRGSAPLEIAVETGCETA